MTKGQGPWAAETRKSKGEVRREQWECLTKEIGAVCLCSALCEP